jgi:hypothetical protein
MRLTFTQLMELLFEFITFIFLMVAYSIIGSDGNLSMDDISTSAMLWVTILIYRLMFCQLPISWLVKFIAIKKSTLNLRATVLINAISFVVMFYIVGQFNVSVAAFVEEARLIIPLFILLSTCLSPVLTNRVYSYPD